MPYKASDSGLFSKFPSKDSNEKPLQKPKQQIKTTTAPKIKTGQSGVVGVGTTPQIITPPGTVSKNPVYAELPPAPPTKDNPIADTTAAANTAANKITDTAVNTAKKTKETAESFNILGLNLWTIGIIVVLFFVVRKFV